MGTSRRADNEVAALELAAWAREHRIQRVEAAILDVAVEHPGHSPAHLLRIGVYPAAPDTAQRAPVAVLLGPPDPGRPFLTDLCERLPRALAEWLLQFRRIYLL